MKLPEHLSRDWRGQVLHAASEAAGRTGSVVYLVGGPVRDLIRQLPLGDLDLAIEGKEGEFAEELANSLTARLSLNERFMTWRVQLNSDRHVDLARLRTESYEQPGALPAVAPAPTIEADLQRRDFTINAMALRLSDLELIDPFGGVDDLETGILRVLHDGSFRDDPTRVFRAIRLASRLALTIEPETAALLDEAIRSRALETVSEERLWKEIDIAFGEAKPVPALRAFAARGCLESLTGLTTASGMEELLDDLVIPEGLDRRVVLLGTLMRSGDHRSLGSLPFDTSTNARIHAIAMRHPALAEILTASTTATEQFEACEAASTEERFIAAAERAEAGGIVERFEDSSLHSLGLGGGDLGVPQGPWIGKALREARRAVFTQAIPKEHALPFARRLAMKYLNN